LVHVCSIAAIEAMISAIHRTQARARVSSANIREVKSYPVQPHTNNPN